MNQATAEFIHRFADADVRQLALQGTKDPEVDLLYALDQIAGRQTARRKLPSWAAIDGIVYPPHLSMEQCSSEQTARYKENLLGDRRGKLVDLTGGFGVDFSFMARSFAEAVYVEKQEALCEIARQNVQLLGLQQATVACGDSVDYLRKMAPVDVIYMDPARRDSHGGRTYGISDCTPDILLIRDLLLEKANRVLLKLSPMLDWRKAVNDIGEQYVREVHIVSMGNECKELLMMVEGGGFFGERSGRTERKVKGEYPVHCINLLPDNPAQDFIYNISPSPLHLPLGSAASLAEEPSTNYLYEPNASIMKAGCFAEISQHFGITQIAQNSHLFVANRLIGDFPGRIFLTDAVTTMNKRELKESLKGISQANIAVRNFPLSVAELRKRLKLSEGGSTYIFATTLASKDRILIICHKV